MVKQFIDEESGKIIEKSVINAITIDCVIFTFDNGNLEVLLIQHANGISKGKWALPGGWIKEEESIDEAAQRLLRETTGIKDLYLEQLKAFGEPGRFPLGRVITIGYYALIKKSDFDIKAGFTAADAKWFKLKDIGNLIYDHNEILNFSLEHLRAKVKRAPIGFNLLPEKFTLLQLMQLYQEVLGIQLDKPNFRRKILKMKLLIALEEKEMNVSHRAAKLYQFDHDRYEMLTRKGFIFEV
ncbi:ADP-ribose pyrophosphatase YjhB, NUDIX family [Pustulibacterium marinum]|uniref:ADP-ribose pyrophosphatase YjhB, NUDIX family n=1 Tax=Pustulibacterium marinum TaxID=1224947 RepID=A0A1I7FA79_9FLAO|nr:NUDIX domain-containing protein [Pustulibacterium marinum]SFU33097.1 ADP-ribose pyrophosphatase YjhB, NUDIX family [Pustulibacterium marinum]